MPPLPEKDIFEALGVQFTAEAAQEFAEFLQLMGTVQGDLEGRLEDELFERMMQSIAKPASDAALGKIRDAVRDRARQKAETLATQLSKAELSKLGQQIAEASQQGIGPREVARQLDIVKGLDAPRAKRLANYDKYLQGLDLPPEEHEKKLKKFRKKLLKQRRETIARTEMRFGTSEARRQSAESRGAKYKTWMTARDSRVSDMDLDNESEGWIPIDQEFPSGHLNPPSHPNCRCTVVYRNAPPDKATQERARKRAEITRKAKQLAEEREQTQ